MIYTESEIALKAQIDELNKNWKKHLINSTADLRTKELIRESYIGDGFYPEYTRQKIKILFIGKEGLDLSGNNYIETLFEAYHNKLIGNIPLNQHRFHNTMLYITYALQYGVYRWAEIPYATEFVDNFGVPGGLSFAFINLSKFSNNSGNWMADYELIDLFLELSSKSDFDFFAREIDIVNPDLIVTMNLGERMGYLGTFSELKRYGEHNDVCYQILTTSLKKQYPLIDTWHFSAPSKSPERDIFLPSLEALRDNHII